MRLLILFPFVKMEESIEAYPCTTNYRNRCINSAVNTCSCFIHPFGKLKSVCDPLCALGEEAFLKMEFIQMQNALIKVWIHHRVLSAISTKGTAMMSPSFLINI